MHATDSKPPTVFISHSSADSSWRDRIIRVLEPLESGGHIRTFTNSCDDSEGEWNIAGATEDAMGRTSVALLLLSNDSLASMSFMNFDTEFFINKASYGEAVLIPVLLFDCDWRESATLAPLNVFRYGDLPLSELEPDELEAALDSLAKAIMAGASPMFPAYFETEFQLSAMVENWPKEFVIVTAYAPTGEEWSPEQNQKADECLEQDLRGKSEWLVRITGFNPSTGHAEQGWAFEMSFNEACDLGREYLQDALYHVQDDQLSVTYCDQRRKLLPVGKFRERVHVVG